MTVFNHHFQHPFRQGEVRYPDLSQYKPVRLHSTKPVLVTHSIQPIGYPNSIEDWICQAQLEQEAAIDQAFAKSTWPMAGEYGSITQPFTDFDSSSLDSSSSVNGSERTITPESFYSMASWNAHCFQPDISSSTAAATHLANSNYVTARRHAEVHKYPNATAPFHHRTYNPASPLQQGIGHACTASQVTEVHFPRRPRTALCNDGGTAWHQGCDTKPSARLINPYSIEGIKATPESRKEFWDWYQRWSQIKN